MLAFLTPSILVGLGMNQDWVDAHGIPYTVRVVFTLGAVLSLVTILWSVWRVPELPLTPQERAHIEAAPKGFGAALAEIADAIRTMPVAMRKLGLMSLFQWSAMSGYWLYVTYSIARTVYHTADAHSSAFHSAVLTNGEMAAFYNGISFVTAFAMVPLVRRIGPGPLHALCLLAGGLGMLALPHITDKALLFVPAVGVGLAWGSIMGNPYAILTNSIPPARTGVYMGIFNMMIVIPMLLFAVDERTGPGLHQAGAGCLFPCAAWRSGQHAVAVRALLIAAALSVLWVREGRAHAVAQAQPWHERHVCLDQRRCGNRAGAARRSRPVAPLGRGGGCCWPAAAGDARGAASFSFDEDVRSIARRWAGWAGSARLRWNCVMPPAPAWSFPGPTVMLPAPTTGW
jgi:maltose/moltooligosaccharide transporter